MKISKEQLQVLQANAPAGTSFEDLQSTLIDKGYEIEGVDTAAAKAYNLKKSMGFPAPVDVPTQLEGMPETPQKDGFLKAIGKDILNTLVVKPAARATEAITRLVAPESMAAKGYEQMADEGQTQSFGGMEVEQIKPGFDATGQIVGEALKVGSFLFPYGKVAGVVGGKLLGSATKLTPTAIKVAKLGGNVVSGATGGYMADVGYNLADESKTLGEAFTPGVGTALGAAIPFAGPALKAGKTALVGNRTVSDVTRRVIQGGTKDIPLAEQAFKSLDTKGVTTRQELSDRLKTAMENQMDIVDTELGKNTTPIPMKDLVVKAKNNAGQEIRTNVVSNALDHLKQFYNDAGDAVSASNVQLIKDKAVQEGLTHQEVNNIARMYSEEFGSKAFNKMGDPLTSVNAQMYENTRTGLKQIARSGISGPEATAADRLYSAMSNTKKLIDKGVEGVSKLEGRIQNRNILQKLSYTGAKLVNTLTGGALKAGVEALGVSNIGNKIDNWMGLEKSLKNDLEFIRKANSIKEDSKLIKFIEETAKKVKFPGDMAVEDIGKRVEQIKTTPGKQGGYVNFGFGEKIRRTASGDIFPSENIKALYKQSDGLTDFVKKVENSIDGNRLTRKEIQGIYDNFTGGLKGKGTIPENSLIFKTNKYNSANIFKNKFNKEVVDEMDMVASDFNKTLDDFVYKEEIVNPKQYYNKFSINNEEYDAQAIKYLRNKIRKGDNMAMPIIVDGKLKEGNHRIAAYIQEGINKIKVLKAKTK